MTAHAPTISQAMLNPPREKLKCRQRLCQLTKGDLLDFDFRFLTPKFPELFRYEVTRCGSRLKIYDSLSEVDSEVKFCERWPDQLDEIVIRKPRPDEKPAGRPSVPTPSIRILVTAPEVFDLRKVKSSEHVRPIDFVGRRFRTSRDMQGCHPRDDKASEKFFDAVFRLSAKFMTNSFEWYNLETGALVMKETRSADWCGPEGIHLGQEDPAFYVAIAYFKDFGTWCGSKAIPKE